MRYTTLLDLYEDKALSKEKLIESVWLQVPQCAQRNIVTAML